MKKSAVIALGLSSLLLFGCEEEKPVAYVLSDFEAFKKFASSSALTRWETDFITKVCQALAATDRLDSEARREILKDYDFDSATIATVERKIDKLLGDELETSCGRKLPLIILGKDRHF